MHDHAPTIGRGPEPLLKAGLALLIALVAAGVFVTRALLADPSGQAAGDLKVALVGARLLGDGVDVFRAHPRVPDGLSGEYSTGHYPLPAYLLVSPLPPDTAGAAIFVFLSTFAAAWLLARKGLSHLLILASFPAVKAWSLAQWSPLLLVAALCPWAAGLALAKPNLGLPLALAFPSRRAALSCLTVLAASVAIDPGWLPAWLQHAIPTVAHVHSNPESRTLAYEVPLLTAAGPLLLLAALRWRTSEGRLLLGLAVMPQRLSFYDQLLLGLTATSARQRAAWAAATWAGAALWGLGGEPLRPASVLLGAYLPALACVLSAPRAAGPPAGEAPPCRAGAPPTLPGARPAGAGAAPPPEGPPTTR